MPTLTFLGAAGTVTGSKHLLDLGRPPRARRLRPVSGAQGAARCATGQPLPIAAAESTPSSSPTRTSITAATCRASSRRAFAAASSARRARSDLCTLVLPDSAHIQEEDARDANKHGYSKHKPALPLYTENDAARALDAAAAGRLRPAVPVVPGVDVEFINAGHLLGSAYARVRCRRQDDPVRRRSRPLQPARAARSLAGRRGRRPAGRIDLRRSAARARRRRRSGWRRSSTRPSQRGGKLIIPVVRDRPRRGGALLAEAPRRDASGFPCCRSTSTARWPRRRCSSTRNGSRRARSGAHTGGARPSASSAPSG